MFNFLWPQALWKKVVVISVLASAVSGGVVYFTGEEEEKGPVDLWEIEQLQKQFGAGEVRFVQARLGSLPLTVKGSGHIHLPRRTDLYFEATRMSTESFTVEKIYVVEGQVVKKGQSLARLDTTTLDRQVEGAELQLKYAQLNLEKVLKDYEKSKLVDAASGMRDSAFGATQAAEKLLTYMLNPALSDPTRGRGWVENPQGQMVLPLPTEPPKDVRETIDRISWLVQYIGSYQQSLNSVFEKVDDMRHAMEGYQEIKEGAESIAVRRAQVQVDNAELTLKDAEDKLNGATLKAPFDGIVEDIIDIEEGERISGTVPIISLIDPSEVEIAIDVGEMDIDKIKMGQSVKVSLDAFPFMKLDGRVTNVPLASETTSGVVTYKVVAEVDPPPRFIMQLREGSSALAEVTIGMEENIIWVPNMAVRGNKVYVVKDNNQAHEQGVLTGRIEGDYTQIISGLKGGETIIVL